MSSSRVIGLSLCHLHSTWHRLTTIAMQKNLHRNLSNNFCSLELSPDVLLYVPALLHHLSLFAVTEEYQVV